MIRVRIIRGTVGDGGRALDIGERLSLPDDEARLLIGLRKAEAILAAPDSMPTDVPESGAPLVQTRDPAPTRTRGSTRGRR